MRRNRVGLARAGCDVACAARAPDASPMRTPGTLDETVEILTWRQLDLHAKPILICDVAGSATPFVAAIEAAITGGSASPSTRHLLEVLDGVPAVLRRLTRLPRAAQSEAARL